MGPLPKRSRDCDSILAETLISVMGWLNWGVNNKQHQTTKFSLYFKDKNDPIVNTGPSRSDTVDPTPCSKSSFFPALC